MGKRIIQQARGKGSLRYRTKKKAFRFTAKYPPLTFDGTVEISKIFNVACYNPPILKLSTKKGIFYNFAASGLYEGQKINIGKSENPKDGDILRLKDIPMGSFVFNIEKNPGSSGKYVRSEGSNAKIVAKEKDFVLILLPSKKEKKFNINSRATIGVLASFGRKEKPILKAGKMVKMMASKGARVYPRTSAVKVNAVDHPFGSGRGKRIKSKIAKRNSSPGQKVGLIRPRRTGKRK